ncbi:MAG: hypothetical protein ACREGJ_04790 [Candidatus Saccharimonadales bacterium]
MAAIAVRHAYAHFRPTHHAAEKPHPSPQSAHLPPAVKEQLLQAAQANFQKVLDHSAEELQHDLKTTTEQMNKRLTELGAEIISDEMKRYRASLDELRAQTAITIGKAQTEVTTHQADLEAKMAEREAELKAKLAEEMEAEKQRLIQQIDTKLADAVASFLIETMQHDVDLGAQTAYLTKMLEEHKDDFKRGVADEVAATK